MMFNELENIIETEEVNFEALEELEEVVTPGWGTIGCCTN